MDNRYKVLVTVSSRTHRPKDGDIMIRLVPHPKGSAKAVVSHCSAELSILKNKMVSSRTRRPKDGDIIELSILKNKMVSSLNG